MRILHIVPGKTFGGGSIIIYHLAKMAQDRGWQADVIATNRSFKKLIQSSGIGVVEVDFIPRVVKPLSVIRALFKLWYFLCNNQYDFVHTHGSVSGFIGRLAARMVGIRVIVHTVHGFAFHEQSSLWSLVLYSTLERMAAKWCDLLVTVSEFHRDWALRLGIGNAKKTVAITNGITPDRVAPKVSKQEVRTMWGMSSEELIIITAGRLAEQKGLEFLIRAVPLLKEKLCCPFKVVLAGEGPLKQELERLVALLGIQDLVLFPGFCDDIGSIISASDIVALPSLREGLSISLLEAMAANKPIVTTTIGSNKEVLRQGECGILVPPGDIQKLAKALICLAGDSDLRKRLAASALAVYEAKYTVDHMLKKYAVEYEKLCRANGIRIPPCP